jgi:DNA-binding CsgD family transcriptional regulator
MLQPLRLKPIAVRHQGLVPALIQPLMDAASRGDDLSPVILSITKTLGFSSFTHGISLSFRPNAESHSFVVTTLPLEWVMLYDQRAYLEVDPRIQFGLDSPLPFIWDQSTVRGKSAAQDAFLDAAASHGIRSGLSISMRDSHARGGFTALSSEVPTLDQVRRNEISVNIGEIMALGQYFHELFISNILADKLPPTAHGVPLSARERQCLSMAANGLTSADIGVKLGITERTANYHFTNIISKLGVLNRKEAVAKAVARGFINIEN